MVSPREGHASGVPDLFFQTRLSNADLVVQSSLFVKDCFQTSSSSLMHIGVTFPWGISLGTPAVELCHSFKEKKKRKNYCKHETSKTFLTGQKWHPSALVQASHEKLSFKPFRAGREREAPGWKGGLGQWLTTEWSMALKAEARRHKITGRKKGSPAQHHCFSSNDKLPQQSQSAYIHEDGFGWPNYTLNSMEHSLCHCCGFTIQSAAHLPGRRLLTWLRYVQNPFVVLFKNKK